MRKQLTFEAVKETNTGNWTVKTQPRKNGSWLTVCDTWCTSPLGDAQEVAELIAKLLNQNERERILNAKRQHVFNDNGVCIKCGITSEDECIAPAKCR